MGDTIDSQAIQDEITELERRLKDAKARLKENHPNQALNPPAKILPIDDGKGASIRCILL
jgi:hypothetical protein